MERKLDFGTPRLTKKRSGEGERPSAADPEERRKHPRLKLHCVAHLYRPGETEWTEAKVENISATGLYCISPQPFLPLEKLECEVMMPAENSNILALRFQAEVLRIVMDGSTNGFGLACKTKLLSFA
jgi:PilZ domain